MSVNKDLIAQYVLTPCGLAVLRFCENGFVEVELDNPIGGESFKSFEVGEVVPYCQYFLIRIINMGMGDFNFIINAQGFLSWDSCLVGLNMPFTQNETVIAVDLKGRVFRANRPLNISGYQIIMATIDRYSLGSIESFDSSSEMIKAWRRGPGKIDGISGGVSLMIALDWDKPLTQRDYELKAFGLFSTMEVISRKVYW
jgi:hypothetical protein